MTGARSLDGFNVGSSYVVVRGVSSSWRATPPFDPDGWGMTLSNVPKASVVSYDPWRQIEPFIDMTGKV